MQKSDTIQSLQSEIEKLKEQLKNKTVESNIIAIEKRNEKLISIINNLNGVVYRCRNDKDWTMEFISDGIDSLTGYPSSDFIDNRIRSYSSIIHPEDRDLLWEKWQDALASKSYYRGEYRILNSNGDVKFVWEEGCGVFEDDKLVALEGYVRDITESRNNKIDLQKKDELLSLVGDMAKVGGWEFDCLTLEGSWNEEVARIHDMDPEDYVNEGIALNFYTDEYKPIIEKAIGNAIEKGTPYDLELQLISLKGIKKWVRSKGIPVYENGKVVRLKGIFQDITLRKEALLRLEDEKLRLKTLIETIPDLVWLKDPDGVYLTCNHRFEKLLNATESEIKGKTDYDFMDELMAKFVREKDQEAIVANKPTKNLEWVTYKDDGHKELLETIKTPMYDSQGYLIGVLGIARDISEKFENEQKLKEKDLIFQSLLDNSPVYIFFKDADIKALYLSKNYESMLGLPLGDVLGKDMNEIFPSDLAKKMIEDDKRIIHEGKLVEVDEELDGRFYTTIKFPIISDDRKPMLAGFTIDVTDKRKAQEELIIAKEKAEESDKLKTAFLQNMSHEIRTPMNAIMGFSELLIEVFDDENLLSNYTEIITERCNDLLRIIDGILDISKIESGQMKIFLEECNITHCFASLEIVFKEYQKRVKKDHIDLVFNCLVEDDVVIFSDQGKMKQILINLVANAFKFTEEGKIEIRCHITDDQLFFSVSDTGCGIKKENQKRIFERFAQIDPNTSKKSEGTGLGLAIVKGLLTSMGGTIRVDSEIGKGSAFYFKIPIEKKI